MTIQYEVSRSIIGDGELSDPTVKVYYRWAPMVKCTFVLANWKNGMTAFAQMLYDAKVKLEEQDKKDLEKAWKGYERGVSGSLRTISNATAELVHNLKIDSSTDSQVITLAEREMTWNKKDFNRSLNSRPTFTIDKGIVASDGSEPLPGLIVEYLNKTAAAIEIYANPTMYVRELSEDGSTLPQIPAPKKPIVLHANETSAVDPIKDLREITEYYRNDFGRGPKPAVREMVEQAMKPTRIRPETLGLTDEELKKLFGKDGLKDRTSVVLPAGTNFDYISFDSAADADKVTHCEVHFNADNQKTYVHIEGRLINEDLVEVTYSKNGEFVKQPDHQKRGPRSQNAKNPKFWAHAAEDKLNGIVQQAEQNLAIDDPTRIFLRAISDGLSDHIHQLGGE